MIYILNKKLSSKKNTSIALMMISGLGRNVSKQISDQLGFSKTISLNQLTDSQLSHLIRHVQQNYAINLQLRRKTEQAKKRLVRISSYRGFRYIQGLPCRGQRTHTNAKTARKNR